MAEEFDEIFDEEVKGARVKSNESGTGARKRI